MKSVIGILVLSIVMAVPGFAQDVVSEARINIETKHHKTMVEKAERLLETKKQLEASLAEVNSKLAKLAAGEDVKDNGNGITSGGGLSWSCPVTGCGNCFLTSNGSIN